MAITVGNATPGKISSVGNATPAQVTSVGNATPNYTKGGTVYWVGRDGNVWYKDQSGKVSNLGAAAGTSTTANLVLNGATEIADPVQEPTGGGSAASTAPRELTAQEKQEAQDAIDRAKLLAEIASKGGDVDTAYAALFGGLEELLKSRDQQLEGQYGDQFKQVADQYAQAIPDIETSYTSIGAGDSTDNTYAKNKAKKGFDDSTATIGKNKETDKAKIGQYGKETKAKFEADKKSATTNIERAKSTTDVDALRGMRNDLETNLSNAGVAQATLGTEGSARKYLSDLTSDNGRYQATTDALDALLKSSLSGAVKEGAVTALTENAGLSPEEKKKVQETYGNVYAEQQAL